MRPQKELYLNILKGQEKLNNDTYNTRCVIRVGYLECILRELCSRLDDETAQKLLQEKDVCRCDIE